jgi:type VI secretion system secreted protein VgrG
MPENRPIRIATPLGEGALRLLRMSGSEELGRLFRYELDLQGEAGEEIDFNALLGETVTVTATLPDGAERFFHGHVSSLGLVGHHRESWIYRATVSPWLWFLTRTANCRIFQNMTVPDILRQVFGDHGFSDVDDQLTGTYREWEYCVQYRETDFNFVSRMMEQEGIYYYFTHEEGAHTLVLADNLASHSTVANFETVPYYPPSEAARREEGHVSEWRVTQRVQPGALELQEYDPLSPSLDLTVVSNRDRPNPRSGFEIRDYPGEYVETGDGEQYAVTRLEEYQSRFQRAWGATNAAGLSAGSLFTLEHHPRDDQNIEHLVTSANYELANPAWETGSRGTGEEPTFELTIAAVPSDQRFVPARSTPKPVVPGPQTAVVTGPAGEEIHTDEHGRITVQFHWDREGAHDENTTCWIRVAQAWAGREWGAIHLPRIGQEVIVDFLEGDPDRPIVTGRVYNAENPPPYALPDNKTQSGIKSRSSKGGGGGNFNEIRMEDKAGEEQVYLHAEKDMTEEVENDQTVHVMNNRDKTVDNDETNHIKNNRTENVDGDETIEIGSNRTESVTGDESLTVSGDRTETISGSETRTVVGGITENVTGSMTQSIAGAFTQTVAGGITWTTPASLDISAQGGILLVAPGGVTWNDPLFQYEGGAKGSFFVQKRSLAGQAFDNVNLALGYNATKIETNDIVFDICMNELANEGTELDSFGAVMDKGVNCILTCGAAGFL